MEITIRNKCEKITASLLVICKHLEKEKFSTFYLVEVIKECKEVYKEPNLNSQLKINYDGDKIILSDATVPINSKEINVAKELGADLMIGKFINQAK